jgi:hypothetical protein
VKSSCIHVKGTVRRYEERRRRRGGGERRGKSGEM